MRIAFNFHGCGAGNNGGTRTIFKSAVELAAMGHEVQIWDDKPNGFDWFKLPASVPYVVRKGMDHGPVDVLVAVASGAVRTTVEFGGKRHGCYWVRGIETWAHSEADLLSSYGSGLALMVNATWMADWIERRCGVRPDVVRPGVESGFFTTKARVLSPVVVGALYSSKPRKRACDVKSVFVWMKREMGKSVSTWLMSNERVPAGFPCDRVFLRPTEKVKRDMYRGIHVWFAPTDNEGLHVPPMEAGLCGCALVAHGIPEAGMGDYAVDGKTALCYPRCDRKAAFEGVRRLAADANLREAMGAELRKWVVENIGTRRQNMERMVGLFEKAMSKTEGAA